uniref:ATPase provides energy for both assembly of type IV secretion complex and secretion of T-DNA complex (VirB4) n=1 Tax=Escherichia coli TaxID=562 RepID=A0A2K9UZN4_ECOLX|nr:ATPase provides energy for both assembly of type IV secretion complex and secretion of T-DNA complex (VirB4) [Escherichia coli]
MSTVFKGLTRPALIRGLGVPLYPFLGMCVICVLLGVWIHEAMYALILPGWYAIKRVTKIDERFFLTCFICECKSKVILWQTSASMPSIMRGVRTTQSIYRKWTIL